MKLKNNSRNLMKVVLTLFFLKYVFFNVNAQWTQVNSGTSSWLNDIDCPTNDICFVAGNSGTVLKTTDAGVNWSLITNGIDINESYCSVDCLNEDTCWIGQGNGAMYKTVDGGITWQSKSVTFGFGSVCNIFMVNDSIGYTGGAGGGSYLKTTDYGETWVWKDVFINNGGNAGVYFINENIGFFGISGGIIKTVNGGSNWTFSLTGASCAINDIFFTNDSIGFAVGWNNSCIFKTTDQGNTWDTLNSGLSNTLYSISCISEDSCYVSGTSGLIIKTNDGGNTWFNDSSGVSNNLHSIFFTSPNIGYAVGTSGFIIKKDINTGIKETYLNLPKIIIAPNPFSESAVIYFFSDKNYTTHPELEVYNLLGQKQLSLPLSQGSNILNRNNLTKGIYIYKLTSENKILSTGKLLIN